MKTFRYIDGAAQLFVDSETCMGCKMCETVCPHQVFEIEDKKAVIVDRDGCMECGACATNCPVNAIAVNPGVGCAALIINRWLKGKNVSAGGCC